MYNQGILRTRNHSSITRETPNPGQNPDSRLILGTAIPHLQTLDCRTGSAGGRTAPGDTRPKIVFLWLKFRKNTGYRSWEDGSGEESGRRQLKRSSLSEATTKKKKKSRQIFFKEKLGDTHQLPPRVTSTLVTPLQTTQKHDAFCLVWRKAQNIRSIISKVGELFSSLAPSSFPAPRSFPGPMFQ